MTLILKQKIKADFTHYPGGGMLRKIGFPALCLGFLFCLTTSGLADFATPSVNVSHSTLPSLYPKLFHVQGTQHLYLIWVEKDGATDYLYFTKSINEGVTWATPTVLTYGGQILTDTGYADEDSIENYYSYSMAVDEPYIHIVLQWRVNDTDDYEILYIRSSDMGETYGGWDVFMMLTTNSTDSLRPDVACRGQYVHVVYEDSWPGNSEIFYKRINNYGAGNMDQTRRLTFSSTTSCYPRVAVSQSGLSVNVVYEDEVSGNYNIMYKHIYGSGAGTYDTAQLTFSALWNGLPDIAVSSGTTPDDQYIYIVYQTYWPGNREIMYKRLDNYGEYSLNPIAIYTARLTYSSTESRSNSVDFDSVYAYVHVSYHDAWPGNYDIMHKKFGSFGGAGFSTQRVSWGTGDSSQSTVGASGTWAYIAWSDDSGGNYDIYIKKGN
jgi:hypothetical protein